MTNSVRKPPFLGHFRVRHVKMQERAVFHCKMIKRNSEKYFEVVVWCYTYSKMTTDVSPTELSTPVLTHTSILIPSPSIVDSVASPLKEWMLPSEIESDDELYTLLAGLESGDGSMSAEPVASTSAAPVGAAGDASTTSAVASPIKSPPRRRRQPERRSATKGSLPRSAKKRQPSGWDTDEDYEATLQVVTRGRQRRFMQRRLPSGEVIAVGEEFMLIPPAPKLMFPTGRGRRSEREKPNFDVELSQQEIELLFFHHARLEMPSRTLMLLTIRSKEQWEQLIEPYRVKIRSVDNDDDATKFSGILPQEFHESNAIDPEFAGPNFERDGKTYCSSCGSETERYSVHVYCANDTAKYGGHWCTFDGLCQMCILSPPAAVRARFKRLHRIWRDQAFTKQHYRKHGLRKKLTNQHQINVEQVRLLQARMPDWRNWKKPPNIEMPVYDFKDFAPPKKLERRVVVADQNFHGEELRFGHRLLPQHGRPPVRVWSWRQLDDLVFEKCLDEPVPLTSGGEAEGKVRQWLKLEKHRRAQEEKERVKQQSQEKSKNRKHKQPGAKKRRRPVIESSSSDDDREEGDGQMGTSHSEGPATDQEDTVTTSPPAKQAKTVTATCPTAKNQLNVNNGEQTVVTSHQKCPAIKQDRLDAHFQLDITDMSPAVVWRTPMSDLLNQPLTYSSGNIEYSADEQQESLTNVTTPVTGQTTSAAVTELSSHVTTADEEPPSGSIAQEGSMTRLASEMTHATQVLIGGEGAFEYQEQEESDITSPLPAAQQVIATNATAMRDDNDLTPTSPLAMFANIASQQDQVPVPVLSESFELNVLQAAVIDINKQRAIEQRRHRALERMQQAALEEYIMSRRHQQALDIQAQRQHAQLEVASAQQQQALEEILEEEQDYIQEKQKEQAEAELYMRLTQRTIWRMMEPRLTEEEAMTEALEHYERVTFGRRAINGVRTNADFVSGMTGQIFNHDYIPRQSNAEKEALKQEHRERMQNKRRVHERRQICDATTTMSPVPERRETSEQRPDGMKTPEVQQGTPPQALTESREVMYRPVFDLADQIHSDMAGTLMVYTPTRSQIASLHVQHVPVPAENVEDPIVISSETSVNGTERAPTPVNSAEDAIAISSETSANSTEANTPTRCRSPSHMLRQLELRRSPLGARFMTPSQQQTPQPALSNVQPINRQPVPVPSPYQLVIAPVARPIRPALPVTNVTTNIQLRCPVPIPQWIQRLWHR